MPIVYLVHPKIPNAQIHAHAHTNTNTHTHTHTNRQIHTNTRTRTQTLTLTHTHTNRQTHTNTRTSFVLRLCLIARRYLAFVYFLAFYCAATQLVPLIGSNGLYPVEKYLNNLKSHFADNAEYEIPTLFWIVHSDAALQWVCWIGAIVSFCVALFGIGSGLIMLVLWVLYMSITNIGQLFYGYGWEMQLLETGFLSVFLVSFLPSKLGIGKSSHPPLSILWLYRWLIFRIMIGAGMIKIRGDSCWRDFTCLDYHYETQPNPNPVSWYLHNMPHWFQVTGVLTNHFVELFAPFLCLVPIKVVSRLAGIIQIGFQVVLIISGNLAFLNHITIVPAIACLDDEFFLWFLPRELTRKLNREISRAQIPWEDLHNSYRIWRHVRSVFRWSMVLLVAYLSIDPISNMISPHQAMNRSFDRLKLVNTYGAFGSVGKVRTEVIISATYNSSLENAVWKEYDFLCKPGRLDKRPCVVASIHYRVDWQIWFAAMGNYQRNPWLVVMISKLLKNDKGILSLMGDNTFIREEPPVYIKADLYEYHFTKPNGSLLWSFFNISKQNWWRRKKLGSYLAPQNLQSPLLQAYVQQFT